MLGKIIRIVSSTYIVEIDGIEHEVTARGILKRGELKPVVGDNVELEKTDRGEFVLKKVLERKNLLKRPRVSNISQVLFVLASKMPEPNILMLDKEICFAELIGVKPIIVINKIDLSEDKEINQISEIYQKAGYNVIKTNAQNGIRY